MDHLLRVFVAAASLLVAVQCSNVERFSYDTTEEEISKKIIPMMPLLRPLKQHASRMNPVGFSWNTCGKQSSVMSLKSLTVTPDPIAAGGKVNIAIHGSLTETLTAPILADVVLEKHEAFLWITIPCEHGVGSCNYPDICSLMPSACPMKQGSYNMTKSFTCPSSVPSGKYRATVNLYKGSTWLACMQVILEVSG